MTDTANQNDLNSLYEQFKDVDNNIIFSIYEQTNRNIENTRNQLMAMFPRYGPQRTRAFAMVKAVLPGVPDEEIHKKLDETGNDANRAINFLASSSSYIAPPKRKPAQTQAPQYTNVYRPNQAPVQVPQQPPMEQQRPNFPPPPNVVVVPQPAQPQIQPQPKFGQVTFNPTKSFIMLKEQKSVLKKDTEALSKEAAEKRAELAKLGQELEKKKAESGDIAALQAEKLRKEQEIQAINQKWAEAEEKARANEEAQKYLIESNKKLKEEVEQKNKLEEELKRKSKESEEKDIEIKKMEEEFKAKERQLQEESAKSNDAKEAELKTKEAELERLREGMLAFEAQKRKSEEEKEALQRQIEELREKDSVTLTLDSESLNLPVVIGGDDGDSDKDNGTVDGAERTNVFNIMLSYNAPERSIEARFSVKDEFGLCGKETIALVSLSDMSISEAIRLDKIEEEPKEADNNNDDDDNFGENLVNDEEEDDKVCDKDAKCYKIAFRVPYDGMFDVRIAQNNLHATNPLSTSEPIIVSDLEVVGEYDKENKKIVANVYKKNANSGITLSKDAKICLYIFNREDNRSWHASSNLTLLNDDGNGNGEECVTSANNNKLCETVEFPVTYDGYYELRVFDSQVKWLGFSQGHAIAKSKDVLVGPDMPLHITADVEDTYTMKVQWDSTLSGVNDWIGLYNHSLRSNSKEIIKYEYVKDSDIKAEDHSAEFTFDIPRTPGKYEFRYFFCNSGKSANHPKCFGPGYFCSGYSESFTVRKADRIKAELSGKIVIVDYFCPSVDPTGSNRVEVYNSAEQGAKKVGTVECNRKPKNEGPNRGQVSIDLQKQEYSGASEEEKEQWVIKYVDANGNVIATTPFPK